MMLKKILLSCLTSLLVGGAASAATVLPADIVDEATFKWSTGGEPGMPDPYGNGNDINHQWGEIDIKNDATVQISDTFPRSGNGSLLFAANGNSNAKAGIAYYPPYPRGFGPFSGIRAASYDWNMLAGRNAPVMRLFLFNGEDHVATLMWSPTTNNPDPLPVNSWQTGHVFEGYVRQTRGNALQQYQFPGDTPRLFTEVQADPAFANLTVRAVEIGFGSGAWGPGFVGAADNVVFRGASASVNSNFEFTPAVAVAPTPVPTMGEWSLILLSSVLGGLALVRVRRSRKA